MGSITSRLSFDGFRSARRRSQQEEPLYSYSLNKNYFSNYFLMGGERFEVSDPDYLFGDSCDLNFLSCTKPHSLPYKKAQQNLLANLNTKQKANNKVSSRINSGLSSPLNILTGRHRQISLCRKQDAQTQTLTNSNKGLSNGPETSQPLVMMINIRKETLRLVKSTNIFNIDSDINSLSNKQSPMQTASVKQSDKIDHSNEQADAQHRIGKSVLKKKLNPNNASATDSNRYSTYSNQTTTTVTVHMDESESSGRVNSRRKPGAYAMKKHLSDSDTISSLSSPASSCPSAGDADDSLSNSGDVASSKSGYTSVKDVPPSSASDDDHFEDALNDTTNFSTSKDEGEEDEQAQQQKSLLHDTFNQGCTGQTGTRSVGNDCSPTNRSEDESSVRITNISNSNRESGVVYSRKQSSKSNSHRSGQTTKRNQERRKNYNPDNQHLSNRVYNIEFQFDTEVDCSIRIFYFCTREMNSNGVSYKPQHATYKSKNYVYKRGLNQKFEQQEHTFQPYLFDEDLLIYKPLDIEGNYNSGAVFPIVIHCVALEGPKPRQSQSLVATVEKSQLDESYSIKPLKQMIFVDGVQYILQEIYGIENKHFTHPKMMLPGRPSRQFKNLEQTINLNSSLRSSMISIGSNNLQNFSDTASIASGLIIGCKNEDCGDDENNDDNLKTSLSSVATATNQFKSLTSENNSTECVICISEERDTMLLPCRHLCLCSSCAHSLRYQASSCPICRCPFKAALNLRVVQFNNKRRRYRRRRELDDRSRPAQTRRKSSNDDNQRKQSSWSTMATVGSNNRRCTADQSANQHLDREAVVYKKSDQLQSGKTSPAIELPEQNPKVSQKMESETCSATPLLSHRSPKQSVNVTTNVEGQNSSEKSPVAPATPVAIVGEHDCASAPTTTICPSSSVTTSTTPASTSSPSLSPCEAARASGAKSTLKQADP